MAQQLLALTGELPASKRGLLIVLTEYRYALHALATQLGHQPSESGTGTSAPAPQ